MYKKEEEKNYNYWQNQFEPHENYMISEGNNEYAIIRGLIFHFIEGGSTMLDVGCACGDNLEYGERVLKIHAKDYKGVDYANGFTIANTKRRPDAKWETMDARELKEENESYDVVVLYDVLDALDGWEDALDEAIRVSKKTIIIVMWMDAHMDYKYDYMKGKGLETFRIEIQGDGVHYHYIMIARKT